MNSSRTLKQGILSLLAVAAMPLLAQATDSVPSPKKTVAPVLSNDLRDTAGEVRILVDINQFGYVTDASIAESSNPLLNDATLAAIHQWTFHPATEDGVAVASKALQPFSFKDGSIFLEAKKSPEDKHPSVKKTLQPTLTADLKNITGKVVLQASIDADGSVGPVEVKSSTHNELEAAAVAALSQWTFKPAIKSGEAVESKVIIPFHFEGEDTDAIVASAKTPRKLDKAPIAIRQAIPELPKALQSERGEAKLELTVDEHGYVAAVSVLESTNEELSLAAREAALQWKFKPALKDGVATSSTVIQPFSFNGGLLTADLPADSMPKVKTSKSPILPEALAEVQGFVKVRLNLDSRGRVVSASCSTSSHDELVEPTMEAAKEWTFKPAIRDGENVPSSVIVPFVFNEKA